MKRTLAALAIIAAAGAAAAQVTITVPDDVPTLALALNPGVSGLASGDTIVLRDTVSYAGTFTITTPGITISEAAGDTVVLDAFGTGSVFTVDIGAGALTIEDLTIQNGDHTGSGNNGGGINVLNAGALTVNNCAFDNNTANIAGAIYAGNCNLTINNSSFTSNTSANYGGALRTTGNSSQFVTITGCSFTDNHALSGNGGAIDHAGSGSPLKISDSVFSQNTCTGAGGALFATQADTVTLTNIDFLDNVALGTASQDSGGVFLTGVGFATLRDCDFERNLCAGSGGGLRFSNTTGDVIDSRFIGNEASSGGAFQVVGAAAGANIFNCEFDGNSARRTGSDPQEGGAILVNAGGFVNIYNSLFTNNTAVTGGAIASATAGQARIYNSTFVGNDANSIGGAIVRLNTDAIVFANSCIFFENLPTNSQVAINGTGNNDEVNYSLVEGGYSEPGVGNIDANPMFTDASNGDYSLMPGSPAIDAGSSDRYIGGPLSDLGGSDRGQDDPDTTDSGEAIIGAVIDMGAFEFNNNSGIPDCPADQNFDGMLSPTDFTAWINNFNNGCD